ncbi:recombinase family protein [Rickettsia endosymbiont of Polydrusus tereticollis]|uniref:recombinase family protein n=1 Tax=Rickettsia endosymbiont of Polydrusus tereticollis TaxID=3066251 RepID=UPI003132CB99
MWGGHCCVDRIFDVIPCKGYLSKTQIYNPLQNPFYYGVMRVLKTGKQYPHKYPPIISKELFDSCQKVRLGKNQPYKYRGNEYI